MSPPLRRDPIRVAQQNWDAAGWADQSLGMAVVTSIMRVHQIFIGRANELLGPHGLTFARFEVLMLLRFSREGRLPIGKIGERLQVHPASVTNAVQRLADAGLVERSANPDDGRSVIVAITEDGRRVVDKAAVVLNEELFADKALNSPDAEQLLEIMGRWRHDNGDFD